MEDRCWIDGSDGLVGFDEFPEAVQQRASDSDTHCDPLLVAHIEECSLDLLTNVPGDSIRRVGAMQRSTVGLELRWQSIELSVQFFRDEQLEEPGFEIIHDRKLWHRVAGRHCVRSTTFVRPRMDVRGEAGFIDVVIPKS